LMVSFVFLAILSNVPIRISHMFFLMCITSRLCSSFRDDQYDKSHKLTLRLHHYLDSRFLFFLWGRGHFAGLTSLTFSSCYFSSSCVNYPGFSRVLTISFKSTLFLLHGWPVWRKWRCQMWHILFFNLLEQGSLSQRT
jgi:hypothetical protein